MSADILREDMYETGLFGGKQQNDITVVAVYLSAPASSSRGCPTLFQMPLRWELMKRVMLALVSYKVAPNSSSGPKHPITDHDRTLPHVHQVKTMDLRILVLCRLVPCAPSRATRPQDGTANLTPTFGRSSTRSDNGAHGTIRNLESSRELASYII